MVLEHADIRILPGSRAAFEAVIHHAVKTVLSKSPGFRSYQVHAGIEAPERYLLTIEWDTLEDHTVGFRESALFAEWRALVGPFFAAPPTVEHFTPTSA